jgi:hypothetical protein
VRQHQNNVALISQDITDKQIKALHAKISATGVPMSRNTRLEALREILGYDDMLHTSKSLTKADAMGLLDLTDADFSALLIDTIITMESGVRI